MHSRHTCIYLPVIIDANLARGFITIHNSGDIFLWGVVWKPHCQAIFCHDAFDFSTANKLWCLDHKIETEFVVLVQQFITALRVTVAKHKVLIGNCNDVADAKLGIVRNWDKTNSRRNVTQTDIIDVSRWLTTSIILPKTDHFCNLKYIQVTSLTPKNE